jgi:primosomal protein N' (replication factor Y)
MFVEVAVNIEAALEGTFHYHVPNDLTGLLTVGHLVEVEFGRRLAQAIIIGLSESSPVEETKPIIALIDEAPVVRPWQIELAQWLSRQYLTPLNSCLRHMIPPGITRWADITLEINPWWDGSGRLTEVQAELIALLRQEGDMRGRQVGRRMGKGVDWRTAATQLARRGILNKGSVLDPPRIGPKRIRTATLNASPDRVLAASVELGRRNKQADVLFYLLSSADPLPDEEVVLKATGANEVQLRKLSKAGLIQRTTSETIAVPSGAGGEARPEYKEILEYLPAPASSVPDQEQLNVLRQQELVHFVEQPATIALAISRAEATINVFKLRNGEKYYSVLDYLARSAVPTVVGEIYSATGANLNHLRKLAALDLIQLGEQEVWRDSLADRDFVPGEPPQLTPDQSTVWEQIKMIMVEQSDSRNQDTILPDPPPAIGSDGRPLDSHSSAAEGIHPLLLHGVTGSGKTEIYLRAVDLALSRGQRAIVLVPEIALTPQTVRRFATRFPGRVAVLHSRLSEGERYDTWRRAREGRFDIVVGPRSALFAPLENLGVIVVDEEHDHSYKQTAPVSPPYYQAREAAIELGRLTGAIVLLGSATPDVVTYHLARAGKYTLLELPKRIMGHRQRVAGQSSRLGLETAYEPADEESDDALTIPLPPIQVVDLRQELRAGNRSVFSRALQDAMGETLKRGEQAILFLNRRGTSTFVMCRDCGHVLRCPRCDMPLTYHRPGSVLVCHHCGRKERPHKECPNCGSARIKYFGLGTEELERLVQMEWPTARTIRWDSDTTAGKDRHEILLSSFINHEADILVGTQMIAKGLDLPLVTLVGVISADVSLGLPDYRIGERTFQVLAQVAGRAGRGLLGGRVVVQTYQPEHYAVRAAAEHDYTSFYLDEIRFRTQYGLPPFRRMAKLVYADPVNERAETQARRLAQSLGRHIREQALVATELIGPTPPFFNRIDGRYRWQIVIRSPEPVRLLRDFQLPANWIVDIDPVSTL